MEYAAFLLGINVGRRIVKMSDLKTVVEKAGYTNVHTVLASGNVRFEAGRASPAAIVKKLEPLLEQSFGFKIELIVRSIPELQNMIAAHPFKRIPVTKNTRRYVTFLAAPPAKPEKARTVSEQFKILKVTKGEVYSNLEISDRFKTPDIMKALGTSYGKKITTRNWNTIQKICSLA
jgi:uncharacterized protein (DUF1697 family)